MGVKEQAFIEWIRDRFKGRKRVPIDIGDDAACFKTSSPQILMTTDIVVQGVHFRAEGVSLYQVGRKLMGRNLSDMAAMGCYPTYAITTFAMPSRLSFKQAKRIYLGIVELAERFGVKVIGGDLSIHQGKLMASVTLLGETRGLRPVRRSGARPGDAIMVTGKLGGSILGKHINFTPRVKEAIRLNRGLSLHAMIDISDGLLIDLDHICTESGVGAILWRKAIPISKDAYRCSKYSGKSPLRHALSDGEDYELLFTLPKSEVPRAKKLSRSFEIGVITAGRGIKLR
jgi:thiamine-monophosphate kinase